MREIEQTVTYISGLATVPKRIAAPGLVRNGLMIVAYNAFEDFISEASRYAISQINPQATPVSSLPTSLRKELTLNSLKNFSGKMKYNTAGQTDEQRILHALDYVAKVALLNSNSFNVDQYNFRAQNTNIGSSDLMSFLRIVGWSGTWADLTVSASSLGFGALDLQTELAAALESRNSAAHDAKSSVSEQDLLSALRTLRVAGCVFESVFSQSVLDIVSPATGPNRATRGSSLPVRYRVIAFDGGAWKFKKTPAARALVSERRPEDALARCANLDSTWKGTVAVLGRSDQTVVDWHCVY